MYFTIAFEILNKSAEAETKYIEFIKSSIDELDWVRPVYGSFVVKSDDEMLRREIREKLLDYGKKHQQDKPMFIISPLIDTGPITGPYNF